MKKTQLILLAFDEYIGKGFIETGSFNVVCIQYMIMLERNWIKFVICQTFCAVSNYMNAKHSEGTSIIIIYLWFFLTVNPFSFVRKNIFTKNLFKIKSTLKKTQECACKLDGKIAWNWKGNKFK